MEIVLQRVAADIANMLIERVSVFRGSRIGNATVVRLMRCSSLLFAPAIVNALAFEGAHVGELGPKIKDHG
jgi:hypothetical protein